MYEILTDDWTTGHIANKMSVCKLENKNTVQINISQNCTNIDKH